MWTGGSLQILKRGFFMKYTFSKEVYWLLEPYSEETVSVKYLDTSFYLPVIGMRPPFYCYPEYAFNYPVV